MVSFCSVVGSLVTLISNDLAAVAPLGFYSGRYHPLPQRKVLAAATPFDWSSPRIDEHANLDLPLVAPILPNHEPSTTDLKGPHQLTGCQQA